MHYISKWPVSQAIFDDIIQKFSVERAGEIDIMQCLLDGEMVL